MFSYYVNLRIFQVILRKIGFRQDSTKQDIWLDGQERMVIVFN